MTEQVAKEGGSSVLSALLKLLDVTRVVHIDDVFAGTYPTTDVLAAQEIIPADRLVELLPAIGQLPDDADIRRRKFQAEWDKLRPDEKTKLGKAIFEAAQEIDSDVTQDPRGVMSLHDIFEPVHYEPLSLSKWCARQKDILIEASSKRRTLLLVDDDLVADGGAPDEGMKIIRALAADDRAANIVLCLLTGKATIHNQDQRWEEYAKGDQTLRDRFLVIAKECQFGDMGEFSRRLRLAMLTTEFAALRDKAQSIMHEAIAAADERLRKLSIVDFDHMVLRVAFDAGIWEPDVLFRLYSLFHRKKATALARSAHDLEKLSARLRSVSHIPVDSKSRASPQVWAIEHEDRFESPEAINEAQLPVQLGDIYQVTRGGDSEDYVLLAQPCDLMVRSANGQRKLSEAVLAPIIDAQSTNKPKHLPPSRCHLLYFAESPGQEYIVDFLGSKAVQVFMLDMCVYNKDGRCEFAMDGTCPTTILPSWKSHYDSVRDFAEAIKNNCTIEFVADPEARKQVLQTLAPSASTCDGFPASVDGSRISFPVRRVGRLQMTHAMELLRMYALFMSRTAFDVDLGRKV